MRGKRLNKGREDRDNVRTMPEELQTQITILQGQIHNPTTAVTMECLWAIRQKQYLVKELGNRKERQGTFKENDRTKENTSK